MKKVIVLLMFITSFVFAQTKVITQPRTYDWEQIGYNLAVSTTADTTYGFPVNITEGVATIWIDTVSTSSLGNITVAVELYNEYTGEWGTYYDGSTLATITVSGLGWPTYLKLGGKDLWTWASKARVILTAASGSAVINVYRGGQ